MNYFAGNESILPTADGRFEQVEQLPSVEVVPGVVLTPVPGVNLMLSYVEFAPEAEAAVHAHEEEQMVFVIEGELEFALDDERRILRAGDVAVIPPGVRHGARAGSEGCREIDVFNPPRTALLDALAATQPTAPAR